MLLIIMLQKVNNLSIKKIIGEILAQIIRTWNPGDTNQPEQPPVPFLNVELTILLKYLNNV